MRRGVRGKGGMKDDTSEEEKRENKTRISQRKKRRTNEGWRGEEGVKCGGRNME